MSGKISTSRVFREWKGHPISDIIALHGAISKTSRPIIYLAGDSSLDNKAWVSSIDAAAGFGSPQLSEVPELYRTAFDQPSPKRDVVFWLNHELGNQAAALNLAVEESTLAQRSHSLLEHDRFIRDNIRAHDFLVVSVGANDIALRPSFWTAFHMLKLAWLTPRRLIERGWGLGYFRKLFGRRMQAYVSRLVEKQKPRAVIVCMVYHPLEAGKSEQLTWADMPLRMLGYNRHPERLQAGIRATYELATRRIKVDGTTVVPCPLFEALDGKRREDFVARVEPSSEGGHKMALQFKEILVGYT